MDIKEYIEKEVRIPTAEVAFTKPQKLPFIAVIDNTEEEGDDFHAQILEHSLTVELYAERIDAAIERRLEEAFRKKSWKVTKDRTWLSGEKMFETIYTTNFVEKR